MEEKRETYFVTVRMNHQILALKICFVLSVCITGRINIILLFVYFQSHFRLIY